MMRFFAAALLLVSNAALAATTQNLSKIVTPSPGLPPAAQAAGFTTLALNSDFTQQMRGGIDTDMEPRIFAWALRLPLNLRVASNAGSIASVNRWDGRGDHHGALPHPVASSILPIRCPKAIAQL